MPIFHVPPNALNKIIKALQLLNVRLLINEGILQELDIYVLDLRLSLFDREVHIPQSDINEIGIHLFPVHYPFRIIHILVKPNVHLLDYILRERKIRAKGSNHLDPIGMFIGEDLEYHEMI